MSDAGNAFAFQTGTWRVRHRKLSGRLVGATDWVEFDGTCSAWELLGGAGNVDDHFLNDPAGPYHAATFRRTDPDTGLWWIWWIDPRYPSLEPPVSGRFVDGVGTFHADDQLGGRPIKVRFIWSEIDSNSARWEQAFSGDGGETWETNWIMAFERTA
ncbi:DUF1579 domain-containing protein [Sphingosinicella sp. CPCC 101087]|uniref:DUF1579 domain-containing protein n=1 Tax=Sphingosinicella sp. CPCC 101087 TaxID=2497754 RepID=UPI00101CB25F|nr:DUF1579 domain-containing protein [Sphingosinicella sp. CPCC 101087]